MMNSIDTERVYEQYYPKVLGYVSSRVFNKQDAEDLASCVFVKVLSALDTFDPSKAGLSTWIYTITRNTVRDYMRKAKSGRLFIIAEDSLEAVPYADENANGDALIRDEQLELLAEALEALPERERDIIICRYYKNLPHKEIAQIMNLSYSNVRYLSHQAMQRLRGLLADKLV